MPEVSRSAVLLIFLLPLCALAQTDSSRTWVFGSMQADGTYVPGHLEHSAMAHPFQPVHSRVPRELVGEKKRKWVKVTSLKAQRQREMIDREWGGSALPPASRQLAFSDAGIDTTVAFGNWSKPGPHQWIVADPFEDRRRAYPSDHPIWAPAPNIAFRDGLDIRWLR